MLSNSGTIRDRNPEVLPAGKLFGCGNKFNWNDGVIPQRSTPEQVQKFRCTTLSAPRIFYGRYCDPDFASSLSHGISTKQSYMASQLLNPQPKSYFEYRLNQKREESVYASQRRAPLGKSPDQQAGLPAGIGACDKRYGRPTFRSQINCEELVNPLKSRTQVEEESQVGLDLYKRSHGQYTVGESYDRKYDWSRLPNESNSFCFGIETPHDNRGTNTKKSLKWMNETLAEKAVPLTSVRVDDFRERNTPQVGKVHDPIKSTVDIDPGHTHGVMIEPDEYGAGDLIHMRQTSSFLRGRDRIRGILAAVRQHLKKANYHNFSDLKAAFSYYDKDKSGTIDMSELRDICFQFHLPVHKDLLELLLHCCDKNSDKNIDYVEFANFLNWKDKMPSGLHISSNEKNENKLSEDEKYEKKIIDNVRSGLVDEVSSNTKKVDILRKQIDNSPSDYTTSYSLLNGVVAKNFVKDQRPYGTPTIRSDLPAPSIRRMGDNANYGDQSDAYGLINPSVYSNLGVFEEDFFKARSQNDIQRIFTNIGLEMSHETFLKVWAEAQNISSNGEVSVESFRNILDEKMAQQYIHSQETDSSDLNIDMHTILKDIKRDTLKESENPCGKCTGPSEPIPSPIKKVTFDC